MSSIRSTILLRGPFWLLIGAWFCANTPQVGSLHVILWVKNAHHFSHQHQLRHQVAAMISGNPADHGPSLADSADITPLTEAEDAMKPGSKADFSVKKIVMSIEAPRPLFSPVSGMRGSWRENERPRFVAHVAEVPTPPPRA